MKLRESGMPAQAYWETLLDVPFILDAFGFIADSATGDIAELGCGYGTFTIPLAQRIRGTVHALDLDPAMVALTTARASAASLPNVRASVRDILLDGFGLPSASCDAALLFTTSPGANYTVQVSGTANTTGTACCLTHNLCHN